MDSITFGEARKKTKRIFEHGWSIGIERTSLQSLTFDDHGEPHGVRKQHKGRRFRLNPSPDVTRHTSVHSGYPG